ncbi:MAG: DUF192 domain-containing protein [Vampirovibrionales bacterium]
MAPTGKQGWQYQVLHLERFGNSHGIYRAMSWWQEQVGVLAWQHFTRQPLATAYGLYLPSWCPIVHTWGVQGALDVVWLDADHHVLTITHALMPWRVSQWVWQAHRGVIEYPAGWLMHHGYTESRLRQCKVSFTPHHAMLPPVT